MADNLERTIGLPALLLISVNTVMGTGVFFLPSLGAANAGTTSLLSWILISAISIYVGFCFAELAGTYPKSGGLYEYCKQAFGPFPAFMAGWGTLLAGNITIAMLIVGAVRYLNPALPEMYKIGLSLFFIITLNYFAFKGMEVSKIMLIGFSLVTLTSFIGVLFPSLTSFKWGNLTPFLTHDISAVLVTTFLIAETFFGWETIAELADETKRAEKYIPIALVAATCIVAVFVILFTTASIAAFGPDQFGAMDAPLSEMAQVFYGESIGDVFTILVYLSIIGSVAGFIVATPRLIRSLAIDKLFISQMSEVHPDNKTPHKAILFQTIVAGALVFIGSGSYEQLLHLLLPLLIILYGTVVGSLLVIRRKHPNADPYITAPGGSWGPLLCVACMTGLLVIWALFDPRAMGTLYLLFSFLGLGLPVYALLVFYYNPDVIIGFHDYFGRLSLWLENFVLPESIREMMLDLFHDLESSRVLEFGSGVGTLTMELADRVGPEGKVYAADLSEHSLSILQERLDAEGVEHVEAVHDKHMINRVHPRIDAVDFVFSVGVLSYLQDPKKVMEEVSEVLERKNGRVCFVEYVDFFWILPDPPWMSDEDHVRDLFQDAGLSVYVKREKGWFWNYLVVYGFRSDEDVPFV